MTHVERRISPETIATADHLRAGAELLDVSLDDEQLAALCLFIDELELWNARTNLVGQHDRSALIDRHVLDALAGVPLLRDRAPSLRIADIGSGAGLPGIPLAIALRTRTAWLIEPRRKRASFLRSMRRLLPDFGIEVLDVRAEDVTARASEPLACDAVVSRAALTTDALQRCAAPLLKDGGLLIAYRGSSADDHGAGDSLLSAGYDDPRSRSYVLEAARRTFRLDVWTRRFT